MSKWRTRRARTRGEDAADKNPSKIINKSEEKADNRKVTFKVQECVIRVGQGNEDHEDVKIMNSSQNRDVSARGGPQRGNAVRFQNLDLAINHFSPGRIGRERGRMTKLMKTDQKHTHMQWFEASKMRGCNSVPREWQMDMGEVTSLTGRGRMPAARPELGDRPSLRDQGSMLDAESSGMIHTPNSEGSDWKHQDCESMERRDNHNHRGDKQQPINSVCKGTPSCGDNHETNDRDVFDHEFRGHVYSQDQGGETEQADERKSLSHQKGGSFDTEGLCEEELTCEGNHAMEGREVYDHESGNHVVILNHRRESDQIEMESDHQKDVSGNNTKPYPWRAPRVMLQYLTKVMSTQEPTTCSVDNYDGEETWREHQWRPKEGYKDDVELNMNQYHKLVHHLYQAESATEDLMIKWQAGNRDNSARQEWQKIKSDVKERCLEMFRETETDEDTDDVDAAKTKAQMEYNQKEGRNVYQPQQLAMFEKGNKRKMTRRHREEDSSDEDEPGQLVCNMTGSKWESLPYPIIVDSGACASVMPAGWCEHVPLRETPQSQAGEFFRAANGQKIHNHGEKVVSMIIKEGAKRDMRFTICDVSKALGSVSQMCRAGHRVVFNPPWDSAGSYIQHIQSGEKMWMEEQNGLYVLSTKVAPAERQSSTRYDHQHNTGFAWPANP